jgi:hypothetical protein
MFSITTAADFLRKAKQDLGSLQARIDDSGRAMNCILSCYHLHEWVWARWLKQNSPTSLRGTVIRDKAGFLNWLERHCPDFCLVQDLANGVKHCAPVHPTKKIEGYGRGPYGIGPYGVAYLLIDMGEEYPPKKRYLVASTVLTEMVAFWDGFFSENGLMDA